MNVYEKVNFYRLRLARKNEKKNFFLPFKTCSKHKRSNWKKKKKPLINFSDIESRHQYRDSIFSRKDFVLDPRKQPSNLPSAASSSSKRIIYMYNTCNEFPVQWNSPVKCGWVGINGSPNERELWLIPPRVRPTRSPFHRVSNERGLSRQYSRTRSVFRDALFHDRASLFCIVIVSADYNRGALENGVEEGYCSWRRVIVCGIGCLETVRWIVELVFGILSIRLSVVCY